LVARGVLLPAPTAGAQELVDAGFAVGRLLEREQAAGATERRNVLQTAGIVERTVESQMTGL
jgi:hypothetical protein